MRRFMYLRLSALAALTVLFAPSSFGQSTASVRISLVEVDGARPVSNAVVTLSGPRLMGGARSDRTDRLGRVVFLGVPAGDQYSVRVEPRDYPAEVQCIAFVHGGVLSDLMGYVSTQAGCYLNLRDRSLPVPGMFAIPLFAQPPPQACID
jgi:hypothetical protein